MMVYNDTALVRWLLARGYVTVWSTPGVSINDLLANNTLSLIACSAIYVGYDYAFTAGLFVNRTMRGSAP